MPHTASAAKRMRQFAKRNLYNRTIKSALKTALTRLEAALKADPVKAQPDLRRAISLLDKSVSKGVLHHNTVARRKSRLMRLANAKKPA